MATTTKSGEIACEMCGHRFDPECNTSCGNCPMGSRCRLSCCPSCGFSMVNPSRSWLFRTLERLASRS